MEARVGSNRWERFDDAKLPRSGEPMDGRVNLTGVAARFPYHMELRTRLERIQGKMEARVGIEPAYTELQSAA